MYVMTRFRPQFSRAPWKRGPMSGALGQAQGRLLALCMEIVVITFSNIVAICLDF